MLDKSERMLKLSGAIARMLRLEDAERAALQRAVFLAKADLVTKMVTEMTSLQGIIGREYALRSGEPQAVALAIGEQYETVPATAVGVALALTDRLDSLVGLFAAGLAPSGAKDPFGLRRAAIGLVQPLIEHDLAFDLGEAVAESAGTQPIGTGDGTQAQVLEFLAGRLRVVLQDRGFRYDVVEAVLAVQSRDPAGAARAVKQLQGWVERPDWGTILPAFARCVRITRDQPERFTLNEGAFVEPEERALFDALRQAEGNHAVGSLDDFLEAFVPMIPAVDRFFDRVLVMADDPSLRRNRLALLQRVVALSAGRADMSRLEGF
jgi:glycyl-tRNA synthetase